MRLRTQFKYHFLLPACIGAALTYSALKLDSTESIDAQQIASLENRVEDLELLLAQKEVELERAREFALGGFEQQTPAQTTTITTSAKAPQNTHAEIFNSEDGSGEAIVSVDQTIKDLSTQSDRDPRSIAEKIQDFLAANPGPENIAIASKAVVDMTENPETLSDDALAALYSSQTNPDLKRVAAQVLSVRGDNSLIEKQISDAQIQLNNTHPAERRKALVELAKTHHASAANAIAPLLQDADTNVKLDALLALRATGNQNHIRLAEALVNHPDPAVSWLANDVVNTLQNLSDKARTRLASADIVAELPIMAAQ